ncbi:MAG: glycosyltransferase family 2 protein [Arenibacterium sp.]
MSSDRSGGDLKITAITCIKNEGPFLLEWIAYNRLIGVTDFLFYSNDCSDASDDLLDALAAAGVVTHLPNPAKGRHYQMEALKHARKQEIVRKADWVWIADVDEFLNIHVGNHTIPALIDACGDPQAISITFQFMANNGIEKFVDEPVITQFLHSHNPDLWCAETSIEVKSLVRADFPTSYYGAHRPFHNIDIPKERRPVWTDGSGRQVARLFLNRENKRRIRAYPAKGARAFATLNHYALRSLESYLVKNDRGDVNREHRAFDDSYWRERNDPAFFDDSVLRYRDRLEAEIETLKALLGVGELHEKAVKLHRQRAAELLELEAYQNMRTQLRAAPMIPPAEEKLMRELGLLPDAKSSEMEHS